MNELTITPDTPSKPNLLDNKLIMLLPLLFVFKGLVQNNEISLSSISPQINIDLNSLRELLTLDNLNSKISTLKKVGPFLPEPTINTLNKALLTYEKVSRIVELVEFLNTSKSFNPISPVKTTGSKDMINQVFMAIEDDLPDLPPFTRKSIGDLLMGEIINIFGNMLPKSMVEKYYIRRK